MRTAWAGGAAVMLMVLAAGAPAQQPPGVRVTPNGWRLPIVGTLRRELPNGAVVRSCTRLSPALTARLAARGTIGLKAARKQTVSGPPGGLSFQVNYVDPPGFGFNDPALGATRRQAFEAALAGWSNTLTGTVPVVIEAGFLDGAIEPDTEGLLAATTPTDGVEIDGVLVPYALAAQRLGTSVNGGTSDLQIVFNSIQPWDYALNGVAGPQQESFVYTALHEVCHGLGFIDSWDDQTGMLFNGLPLPYDLYLNRGDRDDRRLVNRTADQVRGDLVSDDLYFNGPQANAASRASIRPLPMIKLFAPDPYAVGSSISHVDQRTYADVRVGLMTPASFGTAYSQVDILVSGIMADLGYGLVDGSVTDGFGSARETPLPLGPILLGGCGATGGVLGGLAWAGLAVAMVAWWGRPRRGRPPRS